MDQYLNNMNKCHFCESIDTVYCSPCGKYFCAKCKSNIPKRIGAFTNEKIIKPLIPLSPFIWKKYDETGSFTGNEADNSIFKKFVKKLF